MDKSRRSLSGRAAVQNLVLACRELTSSPWELSVPEKTRWPGWGFALLEELDELFDKMPDVLPEARPAMSAWVALGTPLAGPLVAERRSHAKVLAEAAECLDDPFGQNFVRSYLETKADILAMPLDLRIDVMRSRGAESILRFGWREPRKGDLSQVEAMIVTGAGLLTEVGMRTTGRAASRTAFEVVAQVMDLFFPCTQGRRRDAASILRERNRALKRWRHRELEGRTRELLLNFRRYPPSELGVFVSLRRWRAWTPLGGIAWHGVERDGPGKKKVSGPRPAA
jgi:hypothetical protein